MRLFERWGGTNPLVKTKVLNGIVEELDGDLLAEDERRLRQLNRNLQTRAALSADYAVVALLGATGVGKSSVFNQIFKADLATVGYQRPTTTAPLAACAPKEEAGELLDWMQIKDRVLVPAEQTVAENVIVVDMPDIDSIDRKNRALVERLLQRVDVMVWVTSPQKYADDVLHNQFIKRFAKHSRDTVVILTHADTMTAEQAEQVRTDLARLVKNDGVTGARIVLTSARSGEGTQELRMHLHDVARLAAKRGQRMHADLQEATELLADRLADEQEIEPVDAQALPTQITKAAGEAMDAPALSRRVAGAYRYRAGRYCHWLPFRIARRFTHDPLKDLKLGAVEPGGNPAARARLSQAMRSVLATYADSRPRIWGEKLLASTGSETELIDQMSEVTAQTDYHLPNRRGWWRAFNALQWVGWIVAAVGGLWLLGTVLARTVLLIDIGVPKYGIVPIPTWLLLSGLAWTLLVAACSYMCMRVAARRAGKRAANQLREELETLVRVRVWEPLRTEEERQQRIASAISTLQR
ncbi:50S ribosome-binding GTPase [Gleimia hominis]|uniref:50S ribosome-binding GTPase n=1 Tax=Gleimia hominis TaxID=595468 RepID=A0ABU3IBD5_9ACTO|nr:GTPase [Gleimia hominis]MDT3767689.1 50S ribosome-binding GTPase [Gleimia hominis]